MAPGRGHDKVAIHLDAGHGGSDPGVVYGGFQESLLTLAISRSLSGQLEKYGSVRTSWSRADDRNVPLGSRVAMAGVNDAGMFLSIHADVSGDPGTSGFRAYYFPYSRPSDPPLNYASLREELARYQRSFESRQWARSVAHGVELDLGIKARVVEADLLVLRETSMPAILLEAGFVSSEDDLQHLREGAKRDALVQVIARETLSRLYGSQEVRSQ